MKCITSPPLDDAQIVSYVDGEATNGVVAHIAKCAYCSERAKLWTRLQKRLRKQLYRVTCPTPMELGDFHLGLLPAPQVLAITQHLRECPLCRGEVAELENFLNDLAPEISLFGAAKVLIARLTSGMRNRGGLGLMPSGEALRGETKGPLTFEVSGIGIVIDIQPTSEGKVSILGQVAADKQEQWIGSLVELYEDNRLQFSNTVDDLGAFHAEEIMPGSKELRIIQKDHSLIVVSNFDIPA